MAHLHLLLVVLFLLSTVNSNTISSLQQPNSPPCKGKLNLCNNMEPAAATSCEKLCPPEEEGKYVYKRRREMQDETGVDEDSSAGETAEGSGGKLASRGVKGMKNGNGFMRRSGRLKRGKDVDHGNKVKGGKTNKGIENKKSKDEAEGKTENKGTAQLNGKFRGHGPKFSRGD